MNLTALGKQLGMLECDSSQLILALARKYNLTINGQTLITRQDIDINDLMQTTEEFLKEWQVKISRRGGATA